ncbi:unnamed protein product [Lactuca saligna]|uniref:Uncharacterized protein n=1 Tax=Lactuca saligna TaxID=75948 RepID=A0AA35UQU3_LACSI|nr:unnamed protein product [Lactuca saligna]
MGHSSPVRDPPLKSNLKATRNPNGTMETSKVDTPINLGEKTQVIPPRVLTVESTPKQTKVIPPRVLTAVSFHDEIRTSGITANISIMDANVTMGEVVLNTAAPRQSFSCCLIYL